MTHDLTKAHWRRKADLEASTARRYRDLLRDLVREVRTLRGSRARSAKRVLLSDAFQEAERFGE